LVVVKQERRTKHRYRTAHLDYRKTPCPHLDLNDFARVMPAIEPDGNNFLDAEKHLEPVENYIAIAENQPVVAENHLVSSENNTVSYRTI
jgi:hypothetical protein